VVRIESPENGRELQETRVMGSSREYWQYAKECARWAAEAKEGDEQKLLLEMAKAWTNVALVETDVAKQSALEAKPD
jgi:hypothetical protein